MFGVQQGLYKHWFFSDVDEECIGRPMANELNERGGETVFCKRSGATSFHGLAGNILIKIMSHTCDEEVAGGDSSIGCQPQGR